MELEMIHIRLTHKKMKHMDKEQNKGKRFLNTNT